MIPPMAGLINSIHFLGICKIRSRYIAISTPAAIQLLLAIPVAMTSLSRACWQGLRSAARWAHLMLMCMMRMFLLVLLSADYLAASRAD